MFRQTQRLVTFFTPISCILFLQPQTAWACSCIKHTVEEQWERADVVFTGRVVDQKTRSLQPQSLGELNRVQWTFEVETEHKGAVPDRVTIESASNSAACGIHFQMGQRYQVFADQSQTTLRASLCSGTKALAEETLDPSHTPSPCRDVHDKEALDAMP